MRWAAFEAAGRQTQAGGQQQAQGNIGLLDANGFFGDHPAPYGEYKTSAFCQDIGQL